MKILISIFLIILGNYSGRKFDKIISGYLMKGILDTVFVFILCIIWGAIIAFGVREFIIYFNLNIILIIICYGVGLYVSNVFYQDKRADFICYSPFFRPPLVVFNIFFKINKKMMMCKC